MLRPGVKIVLLLLAALLGAAARPPSLSPFDPLGPLLGLTAGLGALLIERAARDVEMRILIGGLVGFVVAEGVAALLLALVPAETLPGASSIAVRGLAVVLFGYTGAVLGAGRGGRFSPAGLRAAWAGGSEIEQYKILDTSVIIDGRIADVCETGFVDGTLVVPQFVLRELQYIADSQDGLKRNRGRKGLEILQRMKKNPDVRVLISEADFPEIKDVDMKLIELAKQMSGKIVTNDFNLNKVSELRGVRVLNINMLANSLKPVVLPGEAMNILILKEGKEPNQGVGYLDDGTMVVVDNAKRFLGRNIAITVTSVLQTTAGKMFFGRCENGEETPVEPRARKTAP